MPPKAPKYSAESHGNLEEKSAIPKFASFRPKIPAKPPDHEKGLPTSPESQLASHHTDQVNRSAVTRPRHRHVSTRNRSHGCHERREKVEGKSQISSKILEVRPACSEDTTPPFVVDNVGDPKNLTYGALDRYSTPSYFRIGAGGVLGSSGEQKIDRQVSSEKGLVLSVRIPLKKIDRRSLWPIDDNTRELRIKARADQETDIDATVNFVSLSAVRRQKGKRGDDGSDSEASSSLTKEYTHYRSIEGKAKPEGRPDDRDLIYGSDASHLDNQEEERPSTSAKTGQNRWVELSRKVEVEPTNCGAWLDLINSQDNVIGFHKQSKRTGLTEAEKCSNADVKLSMYEKALDKVTNQEDRETLLLGMMEEATKIWDNQMLSSRWKSVLGSYPGSPRLWEKFLDFKQTSFSSFRYEEVRTCYLDCLRLLESTQNATGKGTAELEEVYEIQVYVLLRMTLFMRESGFLEHANATWQAILEYEFFRPDQFEGSKHKHDNSPSQKSMPSFEDFWDSEVPRIGENDSEGWRSFYMQQGELPQSKTELAGTLEDGRNLWGSWLGLERMHSLLARDPARTIDDVEENDPYRVILFSDIEPFLIDPPTVSGRQVLLDVFILFCQLPPRSAIDRYAGSNLWRRSGFLHNEALHMPCNAAQNWSLQLPEQKPRSLESTDAQDDGAGQVSSTVFNFRIADYQVTSESLFAITGIWFSAFNAWQDVYGGTQGPLRTVWILNALKALVVQGAGGDSLAEYSLALELHLFPESVKKTARGLLKKQPSNVRLYNAYALIEYRLGNSKKGENTLITSINMGKDLDELAQQDCILLWRTWVWELLNARRTREALERLLAYGDKQVPDVLPDAPQSEHAGLQPALLLRTEISLTATRDYMLSLRKETYASVAMECLFLFTYLKNSQSLSAATSVFRSNLILLSKASHSTARELLHQSFARLLYHHVTQTRLFKPSDIRSILAESIAEFPQNTIFLSLYSWNEARFRIDDRVRSIVKDVVLAKDDTKGKHQESVIPHFFAVYAELHRGTTFGCNTSTIRSTFERAVCSSSGMHCAGLWKLYFLFELSREEVVRAKFVYWRGIRACPWAKELYLLAFEHLRSVMGDAEFWGIYELMGEKELRVHVGLDDIFEDRDEGKKIQ